MEKEEKDRLVLVGSLSFLAGGMVVSYFSLRHISVLQHRLVYVSQHAKAACEYILESEDEDIPEAEANEKFETRLRFLQQVYPE